MSISLLAIPFRVHMSENTSVLCHTGGFTGTNGYAFAAPDGWVGVDAPADFAEWLAKRGIRLAALLLTHAHFDHVIDAARVKREHGCPIYAWEASTPESRLEKWVEQFSGMRLAVEEYPVDELLAGHSQVRVAEVDFRLAHVPGHSDDSVVFVDAAARRMFTGDTLMHGTMGRADFPGGSMATLMRGIREKLLPMGDEFALFPGHGEPGLIGQERPWVESFVADE
jgi:hydroxyacylglutathione hydrolase